MFAVFIGDHGVYLLDAAYSAKSEAIIGIRVHMQR